MPQLVLPLIAITGRISLWLVVLHGQGSRGEYDRVIELRIHLKRHRSEYRSQWTLGAIVKDFRGQKCLESIHFEMPKNSCEGAIQKYQPQGYRLVADMGGWVQYLPTAPMAGTYLTRYLFTQEIKVLLLLSNNYVWKCHIPALDC